MLTLLPVTGFLDVLASEAPTSGVDEASSELIEHAVCRAKEQGASVVIVSHDADWLAPLCDRLCKFRGGRIVE